MPQFLISPGGSEKGMSYWSSVLPCPLAHWYRYRENPDRSLSWGKGATETGKLSATMVGTLFHAYLEVWYLHRGTSKLSFVDSLTQAELVGFQHEEAEAWRLFQAYGDVYKAEICVDAQCEILLEDNSGELGVPLLTSRVDMVAHSASSLVGCNIETPAGNYLWDHKTAASSSTNLLEQHRLQLQVNCYLWNKQYPDKPVIGGIINNIVKTKTPKFERVFVPLPTDKDIENITKSLSFVYEIHEKYGQQMVATKKTCAGDWSPCQFYSKCWS